MKRQVIVLRTATHIEVDFSTDLPNEFGQRTIASKWYAPAS